MESITLGQIAAAIAIITVIGGFFAGIFKWYKSKIDDRFEALENEIKELQSETDDQGHSIKDSKEEMYILINGLLACLKGLKEQGCNGPVTQGIKDIEHYLNKKTHE